MRELPGLGLQRTVQVTDPALRVVRDRDFERTDSTRKALATPTGAGLLTLEGTPHLGHRRLMAPAVHRERVRRYVEIRAQEAYRMRDGWVSGQECDLRAEMMRLTFAIVSRSLFNTDNGREAERVDGAMQAARGRW